MRTDDDRGWWMAYQGKEVEFDLVEGERDPKSVSVVRLSSAPSQPQVLPSDTAGEEFGL